MRHNCDCCDVVSGLKILDIEATIEVEDYNLKLWSSDKDTYICNGQWFFPFNV